MWARPRSQRSGDPAAAPIRPRLTNGRPREVDDADAVPGALAAQLGFESFQALLDAPGDRKALLLVDNCERLLAAAARTIGRILEVCEQPTVLATSRSPLELPGESVVALAPLEVPAVDTLEPLAWPAVELFLERARDAGVRIERADLDAVVDLCGRLDGLPSRSRSPPRERAR